MRPSIDLHQRKPLIDPTHNLRVTAELEGAEDSFLFGGKYGIGFDKKSGGEPKILQRYWSEEEEKDGKPKKMRANDGAVDSKGRFWVSAICDPAETTFKPEGEYIQIIPCLLRVVLMSYSDN